MYPCEAPPAYGDRYLVSRTADPVLLISLTRTENIAVCE